MVRKRWVWGIAIGTLLLGVVLLWLYSHKLWSGAAEQRLDSLLATQSTAPTATTIADTSAALSPLLKPEPAELTIGWETARGLPPRCHHCIAIALIGVDSRLHDPTPHADANHVLLLDLQAGRITIVAIPRDTPADAGFPDTSQYNKLANVRPQRGLRAHLATLAALVGIPEIHYYAELGFSQAFAILRLLRFDNPSNVLRLLRARTGIWGDDYHRVYVQAHFIRQQLLRWFHAYNTPWGLALLRGGLSLVQTNLTAGVLTRLADSLHARGFPADSSAISIVVYGAPLRRVPVYDLSDSTTVATLVERLQSHYQRRHPAPNSGRNSERVRAILNTALAHARQAAERNRFQEVIRHLLPLLRQRAWWQLDNPDERAYYRTEFVELLSHSYEQLRQPHRATLLRTHFLQQEQALEDSIAP